MKPPLEQSGGGFCFVTAPIQCHSVLELGDKRIDRHKSLHQIAVSIMAVLSYGGWLNRRDDPLASEPRRDGMLLSCAGLQP